MTALLVRRACVYNAKHPPQLTVRGISAVCALQLPKVSGDSQDIGWNTLTRVQLPGYAAVKALADSLTPSEWQAALDKKRLPFEEVQLKALLAEESAPALIGAPVGPDQNAILWGVAAFLVDRGKKELQTEVVSRVSAAVCAQKPLSEFLVATCAVVRKTTADDGSTIPGAAALRTALRTDLAHLPASVVTLALDSRDVREDPALTDAVLVVRYVATLLADVLSGHDGLDAVAALAMLPPRPRDGIPFSFRGTPAAASVFAVSILLAGLERDAFRQSKLWNTRRDLLALYGLKAAVLNAANAQPFAWPPIVDPTAVGTCAADPCVPLPSFRHLVVAATGVTEAVCLLRSELNPRSNVAECSTDTYVAELRASLSGDQTGRNETNTGPALPAPSYFERYGMRVPTTAPDPARTNGPTIGAVVTAALAVAKAAADFGGDQSSFHTLDIALTILADVAQDIGSNDYAHATLKTVHLLDTLGLSAILPRQSVRLLTFAADVAQSPDADAVDKSLERFVGSSYTYRHKRARTTGLYLDLNAYVGALTGSERVCPGTSCRSEGGFAGAYVPLGVEGGTSVSWMPVAWAVRSAGVFIQVIDLGTLATWRFHSGDAQVSNAPKVGVQQVFSPGANIVLGLNALPISLGYGFSVTPNLRNVTVAANQTTPRNAVRPGYIFAAVDIPLFP